MKQWTLHRYSGEQESFSDPEQLLIELEILGEREEPTADLVHESGDRMTISVRGPIATIIFKRASLDPPYLSPLVRDIPADEDDVVEFIVGGVATPVPRDMCVPLKTMLEIVRHYLLHDELPKWIEWQEN